MPLVKDNAQKLKLQINVVFQSTIASRILSIPILSIPIKKFELNGHHCLANYGIGVRSRWKKCKTGKHYLGKKLSNK